MGVLLRVAVGVAVGVVLWVAVGVAIRADGSATVTIPTNRHTVIIATDKSIMSLPMTATHMNTLGAMYSQTCSSVERSLLGLRRSSTYTVYACDDCKVESIKYL